MKRLLLLVLLIMILLTACNITNKSGFFNKNRRILSKIEKTYEKYKGYKCKASINLVDDENTKYLMEEKYYTPGSYRFEILEPKESKGIIILNTDDKIFLEHPSINQSISLVAIKSLNNQLLVGDFFEKIYKANRLNNEKIDDTDYLVFEYELEDRNKYRKSARVWLHKRKFIPYKLNIYDENGSLQIEIRYENFKFLKKESKPLFRINIFRR